MGFWDRSLRIVKYLCDHGPQSLRHLAHQTGISKSSVHRLQHALASRSNAPEAGLWETEAGRQWLTRLVVATLYTFGLKRGVGVETMSEFFVRLRLQYHLGCSPTALRGVMQTLEKMIVETAQTWEKEGVTAGEAREIIGAVDETFLEHMLLVLMDLPSGYLLVEEVAADRTYATWKAVVDARLQALGTAVLYLVSDRAKALIQLAETGFECLSMPDFFHCLHDLVKSYSLAIGQRLRHAQQELTHAEERLRRRQSRAPEPQDDQDAVQLVTARRTDVQCWIEVQHTYRQHLETLSLTLHPFSIDDATAQTSAQVARRLQTEVTAIEALAARHQFPACHAAQTKVRKQLPALAALVDFWWAGVERDLEHAGLSMYWRQWAREYL
jgi:IclR helix-turn-helix domain